MGNKRSPGSSIMFGMTIIYDAQWQVALIIWNSDQEYIQTLTGYLQVLKTSELKLQWKPGENIFFRCSKVADPVGSDGIWQKLKLIHDFMYVLVTYKNKYDQMKVITL